MKFRWLKAASWIMAGILLMGCDGESKENPKTEPIVELQPEQENSSDNKSVKKKTAKIKKTKEKKVKEKKVKEKRQ